MRFYKVQVSGVVSDSEKVRVEAYVLLQKITKDVDFRLRSSGTTCPI